MSAPSSSQVPRIQAFQNFSVQISIGGGAGTTEVKRVLDEVQGFLNSRLQELGLNFDRNRDNLVERAYIPGSHEGEQRILLSYENDQTLPHEHSFSGNHDVEMLSSPEQNHDPDTTGHQPEALVATLRSQVSELAAQNGKLQMQLQQTIEEKKELSSRLDQATQERDDLSRQRQTSLLKIHKLNDMIIKNGQKSDEPIDEDLLRDVFKVRNMTTEVIKRFFPEGAKFKPDVAKDLTKRLDNPFYSQFYGQKLRHDTTLERRRRRLISLLFRELQLLFFGPNARRFGLRKDMEERLQEYEMMIEKSTRVDADESLDWRTRTISYAIRQGFDCQETIDDCARRLSVILEPMVLPGEDKYGNPDKSQVAGLLHVLYDLCSAALNLALRFRSSKTKYEFINYADNTSLAACDPEFIKMLDSEGPMSKPMDPNKLQIFCTLFGALVKTRPSVSGKPSNPTVLEPGHVIVYEPPMRGPP